MLIAPNTRALTLAETQSAISTTLVTAAQGAVNAFTNAVKISPIGMLHLERIEMSPAGIERGELLATIPLSPGETTSVVQHEWTVTNEEFSSIVTDSLENYSERGVTEKTELAQATSSETKRSQQFGVDASLWGSFGFVTFATNAKSETALSTDQSEKASRNHSKEVTAKASSRVRKERKVTIQTSSTTGQEQTNTRTLTNPSTTDSTRIDYYSMMRKWEVRLLQYGLRLTYDIAIPEPGEALRKQLADLAKLRDQLAHSFVFNVDPGAISADPNSEMYYLKLANQKGASVPTPPKPKPPTRFGGQVQGLGKLGDDVAWHFVEVPIDVEDGFEITDVQLEAMIGNVFNKPTRVFEIFGYGTPPTFNDVIEHGGLGMNLFGVDFNPDLTTENGFLKGATGQQKIVFRMQNVDSAGVTFNVAFGPTAEAMAQWQMSVWQALHDAALNSFDAGQQAVSAQIAALEGQIAGVDTLTLRQEELEEVMKGVLRWLLGPDFQFMPPEVLSLFKNPSLDVAHGMIFTDTSKPGTENTLGLVPTQQADVFQQWMTMFQYQEMVKFLHEAIEWENLIYFPYPYFWDVPAAWDFVRTLEHPDPTRQQFLRAGSARVVMTVRQGWEDAFIAFVDLGDFGKAVPQDHPYITIGQEIQAYGLTNYPGASPANPQADYRPLLTPLHRVAWQDMQRIIRLLGEYFDAHNAYPSTSEGLAALSGLGSVPAADPWGNPYVYQSPGSFNDYELSSLGADAAVGGTGENADITSWATASLIGLWYEYTPSHGTDIQVNTAPADMA
jgi:type II secretion system (T2SS) protein G